MPANGLLVASYLRSVLAHSYQVTPRDHYFLCASVYCDQMETKGRRALHGLHILRPLLCYIMQALKRGR